MNASISRRVEALESKTPAEGLIIVRRFFGGIGEPDPDVTRVTVDSTELTRDDGETEEQLIQRSMALAQEYERPGKVVHVICWPD